MSPEFLESIRREVAKEEATEIGRGHIMENHLKGPNPGLCVIFLLLFFCVFF